ncbi:MAG: amino acid permease, partial [Candidatus Bathyarchaeia archaeon]
AVSVSVGAIVGAGIFVVTGIVAGLAGSALPISMLIAALISLFTASSFAELTIWQPKEGSIYEYTYQLISPFAGFLTGWMWILSNTFAGTAVSLGFAYYLNTIIQIIEPKYVAALACLSFTILNYYGIKESARLNNVLVIAKLAILALFVIVGANFINVQNYMPFTPLSTNVLYGAFYAFFAYGGFARVAVVAEEIKDAKRNVPRAILFSLLISTMVYVLVGAVAVGLVGSSTLANSDSPLTEAIKITAQPATIYLISVGAILATASVLLTAIIGVSRMAYAMAKRKDLPELFSKVHPKHGTPHLAVWITGGAMTVMALFLDISGVVAMGTFALLFYYTLANICALRLKNQKRVHSRLIGVAGAVSCLLLLTVALFVTPQTGVMGFAALAVGTLVYAVKRKRR